MKRTSRSRKGFTLAEMVLVIAIIVILAGAAAVGVVEKINRANQNAEAVRLHAAGGYFWTVEGGHVVELDPNDYDPNNPYHRSGGAMDMQYDEVKYIQGTVPTIAPQTYNPGGGDPIGPGNGGSGGDNPGSGTPELWNGHTEEWWNENDAKWEEKIQQLKDQGIPPENIHVTKDERGHITGVTWSNPTSGGNSSSSTGGGSSSTGGGSNPSSGSNNAIISVPNTVSSGKGVYSYSESNGTATVSLGDSQWNTVGFTLTKDGDNYIMAPASTGNAGSGWYTLPDNLFPARDQKKPYTLNPEQKAWLEGYGITFN